MGFVIKSSSAGGYLVCDSPENVLVASQPDEIRGLLQEVETLQAKGYYVGGYLGYEAARGFDDHYPVHTESDFPLAIMLASRSVKTSGLPELEHPRVRSEVEINQLEYQQHYEALLRYIEAGDIYQANFSFRSVINNLQDGFSLFCKLEQYHPMPYAGFIEHDGWQVISLSPELFLSRRGEQLWTEPMKGTTKRGLWFEQDETQRRFLESDSKNRAENLMIVDLMRNDLSKISKSGSVEVPVLFESRRFPSLHQLISVVRSELRSGVSLFDVLKATFPAGAITGAPKLRAMEIINELEDEPRDAYTGSVGIFLPGGDFQLNVAIRTLSVSNSNDKSQAKLGIGSGVVSPSSGEAEWRECLLKSEFLNYQPRHREIFETILFTDHEFVWLDEHLNRLKNSCEYFLVPFDRSAIEARLRLVSAQFQQNSYRVRLSIGQNGNIGVEFKPLVNSGWDDSLKVLLSDHKIDVTRCYQYHKTDYRTHYDQALSEASALGFGEVLFFNNLGQLTEGAISNVFLLVGGEWLTPGLDAGLLPGVWRAKAIEQYDAKPCGIDRALLCSAQSILIGNSVRMAGEVKEVWADSELLWSRN